MIEIPTNQRGDIVTDLMPDLTPLLDVMFMLIVFFILTANAVPFALDVNLPEDSEQITQAIDNPDMLSVTLLPGTGGWKVNDTVYNLERDFKKALETKARDNKEVVIIGDQNVSMQKLLSVMAFLRKHNIEAADIIMEQK